MRKSYKMGLSLLGISVWGLAMPYTTYAQDKVEVSVGADLVSSYEWRGQHLSGASVQPSISLGKYGVSLTAWGSVALDQSGTYTNELDFTLGYSIGGFSIALTDYFCIPGNFDDAKYFMYDAHKTAHLFEATLGYDFGPVALSWNTSFAGADYYKNEGDNRSYSSYVEISAPFTLGGIGFKAEVGATPWYGAYNLTGNGFSVVNIGLTAAKELKIADFVIPVFVKVGVNPQTERTYTTFGLSF